MMRLLVVVVSAALLVASGFVYGLRTDRWRASEARTQAAAVVASIPERLGDWRGEPYEIDERLLRIAEADATMPRRYVRGRGQDRVEATVILLSGRAAPMAVHTPDVCFRGAGFHLDGQPQTWKLDRQDSPTFWTATFAKPGEPAATRVYWAWSDGGPWTAADDARLTFNHSPVLYKLYVLCSPVSIPSRPDQNAGQALLVELIPELQRRMHP